MINKNFVVKLRVVEIYEFGVGAKNKEDAKEFALQEYEDRNLLSRKEYPDTTISIDSCNEDN